MSWCNGVGDGALVVVDSQDQSKTKVKAEDQKVVSCLHQNLVLIITSCFVVDSLLFVNAFF